MAMGKPVVATDIVGSGVPWVNVHGVTGYNTPVGQALPLAATLSRLLSDGALRERMGAAARQRYLNEFNADRMSRKTLDLYESLVKAPRSLEARQPSLGAEAQQR